MEINEHLLKLFQIAKDMENLGLFSKARLSKTEFRLLREVIVEGEDGKQIISSELARRLGVTRSAVSQIITKLEERNVVERIDSPTDKKIAYIRLTGNALAVFEEMCKEANRTMEKIEAELGEEKLDALVAAYDEFLKVFKKVQKEEA